MLNRIKQTKSKKKLQENQIKTKNKINNEKFHYIVYKLKL